MLTLLNAKERSKDDFATLFETANPGYRFLGVTRPEGCRMGIVEAVWEGEDFGGDVADLEKVETVSSEIKDISSEVEAIVPEVEAVVPVV